MPSDFSDQLARWWSAQLIWRHEPTLWVLGSLLLGLAAWWLLWLALRVDSHRGGRLQGWLRRPSGQLLAWLLRLAWLILPGYAALLLGAASPRLMGLTQLDWGVGFGFGLAFVLLSWTILLAAGLHYRRTFPANPPWETLAEAIAGSVRLFMEAGGLQWQWAFYRSAAIAALTALASEQAVATGAWLAAGLISGQGVLSPLLWRDLRQPGRTESRLLRAVMLIASSILYLLSRNFWLCWALHAVPLLLLEPRLAQPPLAVNEGQKRGLPATDGRQQPSQTELGMTTEE